MRLILTGPGRLEVEEGPLKGFKGNKRLRVLYCAVCRTDAKMWHEGHRDLRLPRVPGHEVVAADQSGMRFVVWPGECCGRCFYCQTDRENLCDHMKIMGFHRDGGFSTHVDVRAENLIPVPESLSSPLATFAEPVGCVHNALSRLDAQAGERMVIYGGGVLGLIAALAARDRGIVPLVIERNVEKIAKAKGFLIRSGIQCVTHCGESRFELALNACGDPGAFAGCLEKLAKGGRMAYFSGLAGNAGVETNTLNLLHYKETVLSGAYGLTRTQMASALPFIGNHMELFEGLIEAVVSPREAARVLPRVLSGGSYKYLLDFEKMLSTGSSQLSIAAP